MLLVSWLSPGVTLTGVVWGGSSLLLIIIIVVVIIVFLSIGTRLGRGWGGETSIIRNIDDL